jgi:hypothetical protein
VHLSQQTEIMPANKPSTSSVSRVAQVLRALLPLLIVPLGLLLFVSCVVARFFLWNSFGGETERLAHLMFGSEIPGTTSAGFGFAWGLTVFGASVIFFAGSRWLVRFAWMPKPV